MRSNRIALVYYVLLLIISGLFIAYHVNIFSPDSGKKELMARKGILDLSRLEMHGKSFPLQGEFEFYWKQLYGPEDFSGSQPPMDGYIELPGLWNGYTIQGEKLNGLGYATFRLRIVLPGKGMYQLNIRELDTAYRLWANHSFTGSGKVDTTRSGMIPDWSRNELRFYSESDTLDLVLQVSNYYHRKGGPEEAIYFGRTDEMSLRQRASVGTETFILGFLLLTMLFHLGLYFFRMKDPSNLFFAFLNMVIALRLLLTGEKLFLEIFPFVDWFTALRLEYMTVFLPPAIILFFFHATFPGRGKKWASRLTLSIAGIFLLSLFVLPPWWFTYLPVINQAFVLFVFIYVLWLLLKPLQSGQTYIILMFAGAIIFGMIGLNELMYFNNWLHTGYLLPMGLLVFIFSISYGLSGKFTQALDDAEYLRNEMESYSKELEAIVKLRTEVTEEQKERLEIQTEELKDMLDRQKKLLDFKEMMTGILVHDMKNPLGAIISLDEQSSPEHILLARQSGNQLLNLIQNLMETQKFEEAGMRLKLENCPVSIQVERAVEQVKFLAMLRNLTIRNNIDSSIQVRSDSYILERIFTNLLINAVKFTPQNGSITISAQPQAKKLRIEVSDTGIGIDPEYHEIIFNKYGQVDDTGAIRSTGLGLAFCKMAVEAQGGKIGVDSMPGKGSTFWFILRMAT